MSANYSHDGSVQSVAGVSTGTTPAQIAKHGYIAQLHEVTGLTITAAIQNVNEGATLQLGALQLLDDATFLAVPAASVNWSVLSGPITGIDATGLATAGAVAQNTAASVQGLFGSYIGSLNLTVLDTISDNFGTYARDSLEDSWQVQYFGQPPNANAGPLADPDRDGQINAFEFTAGLIPTDASSVFRLRLEAVPGQPSQKKVVFSPRLGGRSYTLKATTSLLAPNWQTVTSTTTSDNGTERSVTDLTPGSGSRFYQVEITRP